MPIGTRLRHFFRGFAEDDDIVIADMFEHLDICTIKSANGERTVQRKFHVTGAGCFHAGS
ncbi:hypothetical protein D3C87_1691200 [compost metagenome]